jgi:plastocyanin
MKKSTWLLAASMSAVLAAGACGGGSGGSTGGSTGSGGSKTGSTGSGGGSTGPTNGCTLAMAEDDTSKTAVTITFPTGGLKYAPACLKVKTGTMVTFSGDFMAHPLAGGVSGTVDATSPITETKTGMTATFTMTKAGTYGFFCEYHEPNGMWGAIYVQ